MSLSVLRRLTIKVKWQSIVVLHFSEDRLAPSFEQQHLSGFIPNKKC